MDPRQLESTYRAYIACLNRQDWGRLANFVHAEVHHNGRPLGVAGYRAMLEVDYQQIPDLRFEIQVLVTEPPHVACRLRFDVTPRGEFLGLPVNGRRVQFCENVIYAYVDGKIRDVWSVIDRAAIEAQVR